MADTRTGRRRVTQASAVRLGMAVLMIALAASCTPAHYRRRADRETYQAIEERLDDPRWAVPSVSIQPHPESRLADHFDPDYPPIPPDDPVAHRYMLCSDGITGYRGWNDDGSAPYIESPRWRDSLALTEDGTLILTPDRAIQLGLIHSREYQTEQEDLYLEALDLTLQRFEFDLQWIGGNDTTYQHFGTLASATESDTLRTASNLGFSRNFSRGGQLVVDFANSFVWEFAGADSGRTSSNITVNLVQPLLRRAGREVRLEGLTQSERDVLYAVRRFARFRKQFYIDVTTGGGGYLSLLLQLQSIRNQEANLIALEQNLDLYDALAEGGSVSRIQVDQVFQSYQRGRLSLLQAQSNFEIALDSFKIKLGLPPTLPVTLDDSLLAPFQLNDPDLTDLEQQIDRFLAAYRELDEAPSLESLKDGFQQLQAYRQPAATMMARVRQESDRWNSRIVQLRDIRQDDEFHWEVAAHEALRRQLAELPAELAAIAGDVDQAAAQLSSPTENTEPDTGRAAPDPAQDRRNESWDTLRELAREYLELLAELFVLETEIRVYLIELEPVEYQSDDAIRYALANRLDLMNGRAGVVDAWRQIKVAQNSLESNLDVVVGADVATPPGSGNPLNFSASASSYRLGLQFDAPLNRKVESSIYRTSLIDYQRARRSYMGLEDRVAQAVRRDLKQLETDRLNFEIARESLVVAARQVEETRDQLLLATSPGDSSSTQDVLNALNALLQSKNTLIGIWVSYEANRMQLLLDLDVLQLDERGVYRDERTNDGHESGESDDAAPGGAGLGVPGEADTAEAGPATGAAAQIR